MDIACRFLLCTQRFEAEIMLFDLNWRVLRGILYGAKNADCCAQI